VNRALARQMTRYLGTSVLSAAVSFGLPVLLHEVIGIDPRIAVAIGFVAAFAMNFVLIRRFVFARTSGARADLARFALTSLAFRGAEYLGFLLLFDSARLPYAAALLLTLGSSFCAKFFVQKHFVFRGAAGRA
jgi:putative flippase GtrA